jgi:ketosteroid isomerase-like protein
MDDVLEVVTRFARAFSAHDVDALMGLITDDCVFEDTSPPDGVRHTGRDAVRKAWEQLFASSPGAVFSTEDDVVAGDRVVSRWTYRWGGTGSDGPDAGHVRGVDLFRVRDGKVAEKLSYVKG